MSLEEALAEIQTKPLVDLYPPVAMVYGVSRGTVYEMARRGEIDVLEVGRLKKAITSPLRRKLGMEVRHARLEKDRRRRARRDEKA